MAKKGMKDYLVYAKLSVDAAITVKASSLEEAVAEARNLGVTDFVDVLGEHNDSSHSIYGVYEDS